MALTGDQAYALSKKFTRDSIAGAGAVAGKPCQIDSVTPITGGNRVTFLWEDNAGTSHTSTMDVMDGADGADGAKGDKGDTGDTGKGIKAVTVNAEDHLIITYTDDTTTDAGQIQITAAVDSVNGKTGTVVLTASDVGALADDTEIPTKTSDLTNDSIVDSASYDSANHQILFKNGTTTLFSLDAAAFVKDGMVDDVEISGGNLVITFNTDAGKQAISIPLIDIFNPANYYDKDDVDGLLADKADKTDVDSVIAGQQNLLKDTVGWTGKNLLKNTASSQTIDGVTFTVNSDGSVTANGTGIGNSSQLTLGDRNDGVNALRLKKGKYTINGSVSVGNIHVATSSNADGSYLEIPNANSKNGNDATFEITDTYLKTGTDYCPVSVYLQIGANVANNFVFKPMIRKADITDPTYEPYHESVETMYEEEIHGINLFNVEPFTKTSNDITITVANNIVTLDGTPSANGGFTLRDFSNSDLVDGETYIISDGNASNYSNCYIYINGEKYDGSTVYDVVRLQTKATLKTDFSTYRRYFIGVYIRTEAGTLSNKKFNIMIRKADIEDSTYRPYNEQAIQNQINVQGVLGTKNLLPQVEHANTTMTINGVTITSREDGSVLLNGTSTAAVSYHFIRLSSDTNRKFIKQVAGKKVMISGTNVLNTNARVQFWSTTTNVIGDTTGNGTTFTIPSDLATTDDYNFAIWIPSGVTINNIIVYPMLRLASDPDNTYQPYAMTNRELTELASVKTIQGTATNTTSNATPTVCTVARSGNTCQFIFGLTLTAAVNVGSNVSFTITGLPKPKGTAFLSGFAASTIFLGQLAQDGTLTIRVLSANASSGYNVIMGCTYVTEQ